MDKNKATKTQHEHVVFEKDCSFQGAIGPYPILREISRGGMGVILESFQKKLNRRVAIKVLPFGACHTVLLKERFKREAEILAKIRHHGVAQVYDFGSFEAGYYLVMEYVEGKTLEQTLSTRTLSLNESLEILVKVAGIVKDLHERNIIHRDIKPSNVMLKENGDVVLLDFGISKCLDDDALLKLTHDTVGTPFYMPPEFFYSKGKAADIRSDVYSLGVMMYEMVTGRLPFNERDSVFEIVEKILAMDFPRPGKVKHDLPSEIEAVILKSMASDPKKRYSSMTDLVRDLECFLKKGNIESSSIKILGYYCWKKKKKWLVVILSFFLVLYLSWTIFFNGSGRAVASWTDLPNVWKGAKEKVLVFDSWDEEIPATEIDRFLNVFPKQRGVEWKDSSPGVVLFPEALHGGDLKVSFMIPSELPDSFFGIWLQNEKRFGGYLLRVHKEGVGLCRNNPNQVLKLYPIKKIMKNVRVVFEKKGPEVMVFLNRKKIISFLDYNPATEASMWYWGLYFQGGEQRVIELDPEVPRHPLMVSPLIVAERFMELGQYEQALKEYDQIIKSYSGEKIALVAYLKKGMIFLKQELWKEALSVFNGLLRMNPDSEMIPEVLFQKGKCLFIQKRYVDAEKIFFVLLKDFGDSDAPLNLFLFLNEMLNRRLVDIKSEEDYLFLDRGFSFLWEYFPSKRLLLTVFMRQFISFLITDRQTEKALNYLNKLPVYFPSHKATLAWGAIQKGEMLREQKKYSEAKGAFYDVLTLYQGVRVYEAMALMKTALLFEETGKFSMARDAYRTLIANYPDQKEFIYDAMVRHKLLEEGGQGQDVRSPIKN